MSDTINLTHFCQGEHRVLVEDRSEELLSRHATVEGVSEKASAIIVNLEKSIRSKN